ASACIPASFSAASAGCASVSCDRMIAIELSANLPPPRVRMPAPRRTPNARRSSLSAWSSVPAAPGGCIVILIFHLRLHGPAAGKNVVVGDDALFRIVFPTLRAIVGECNRVLSVPSATLFGAGFLYRDPTTDQSANSNRVTKTAHRAREWPIGR